MSGIRKPLMINGVPVVAASPELDLVTAEQLRTVLLRSAGHRHPTIVVDMTRTRLCDPAGLNVLIRAHMQALAAGGGLRVVIPAGSPAFQLFRFTGLDRLIPRFASLDEALTAVATAPRSRIQPPPSPKAGLRR
jgi:anti-anti-sigma factor